MYMYIRRCRTWRRTSADDSRSAAAVYGVDDGSAARSLTVVGRSCRLAAFIEGPPFSGPAFSGPAFSAPPSAGVLPTVRPSVTFVYSIQTAEDIVKILSRPDSPIILVFDPE